MKYMELTGVNPAKSVYIGDTLYDQQCADAAKIDFALALWGHPDEILRIVY